ncbi:uncharacterized protein [Macrobrachium rosenbergii]|uniref:uncharacterized protein n=1 Tax=Macrobrachium rosenbergii TaxID=79674 RepID=UPI0034D71A0D
MDIAYKLALFLGTLLDFGSITGTIQPDQEISANEKVLLKRQTATENSEGTSGQDSLDFKRNYTHEIVKAMKRKTERLERENNEYRRLQTDNERLVNEISQHVRTITNLQKEVSALTDDNKKTKSELEEKIRLLSEDRNRLENGNVEKQTKIEQLEKEKREAWNTITSLESGLEDLKGEITALTVTAQEIQTDFRVKVDDIGDLTKLEEDARRKSDSITKADEEQVSKESSNREKNGHEELKREEVDNENETPEETGHELIRKGHKMQFWKKWKNKRKFKREAEHEGMWEEPGEALLEEWQQLSHSEDILDEEIGDLLEELEELLDELEQILKEEEETAAEEEAVDLLEVIDEMIEEEMSKIVEKTQAQRWPKRGRRGLKDRMKMQLNALKNPETIDKTE